MVYSEQHVLYQVLVLVPISIPVSTLRLVSSKNIKWYFGIRVNFDINQDVNQLMYLVDVKIRLFGFICYFVNPFHVSSLPKKEDGTLFSDLFGVTS